MTQPTTAPVGRQEPSRGAITSASPRHRLRVLRRHHRRCGGVDMSPPLLLQLVVLAVAASLVVPACESSTRTVAVGGKCYFGIGRDGLRVPVAPYCQHPWLCVVNKVLPEGSDHVLEGTCHAQLKGSEYNKFCAFQSILYAPGTTGIRDNPDCSKCTCQRTTTASASASSSSGGTSGGSAAWGSAQCVCQPGPACRVDVTGREASRGPRCSAREPWCVVTHPNNGTVLDAGRCTAPQRVFLTACVSLGPGWGPTYYAGGMKSGALAPGNLCSSCSCTNGRFHDCRRVRGCKMCVAQKDKGALQAQCTRCCATAATTALRKRCQMACARAPPQ